MRKSILLLAPQKQSDDRPIARSFAPFSEGRIEPGCGCASHTNRCTYPANLHCFEPFSETQNAAKRAETGPIQECQRLFPPGAFRKCESWLPRVAQICTLSRRVHRNSSP